MAMQRRRCEVTGAAFNGRSAIRATKASKVVSVALKILARLSVLGQRGLLCLVTRLLGLNVVGSRPARRARPEAERPRSRASRSMPCQTWSCVNIGMGSGRRQDSGQRKVYPADCQ